MIKLLTKYGVLTIINQLILFFGIYFLVDLFNISADLAFFILITFIYFLSYLVFIKFIFPVKSDKKVLTKYIITLFLFWLLNNISFSILINILGLHYLLSVVVNIFVIGIFKFFIQKNIVFARKV